MTEHVPAIVKAEHHLDQANEADELIDGFTQMQGAILDALLGIGYALTAIHEELRVRPATQVEKRRAA